MIIYHPYKDANHCAYRVLSILSAFSNPVNINYLHMADFYHLFPCQLKNIKNWPNKRSKIYKEIQGLENGYELIDNPRKIFFELKSIRNNVLLSLFSKNIIQYGNNLIGINEDNIPESMLEFIKNDPFRTSIEFEIITTKINNI